MTSRPFLDLFYILFIQFFPISWATVYAYCSFFCQNDAFTDEIDRVKILCSSFKITKSNGCGPAVESKIIFRIGSIVIYGTSTADRKSFGLSETYSSQKATFYHIFEK